jgi:hypothetical protein
MICDYICAENFIDRHLRLGVRRLLSGNQKASATRPVREARVFCRNPEQSEGRQKMVSAAGFEPATHALKGHCSTN